MLTVTPRRALLDSDGKPVYLPGIPPIAHHRRLIEVAR